MSIGNWYRVGSVAVTNGSVNVVGTGTFWSSQCNPGDRFTVDGENWYEVNSITDDTHLAILSVGGSGGFAGASASNLAYAIDRNFTNNLNANIAASVASLVAQYQANSNGPLSGLFGNGAAATPGIAFLNEASTGFFHPSTGIAALAIQGAEVLRVVGSAAGVPAMIGQGTTAPANAHDISFAYNALFGVGVANTSSGVAARASFTASNGTQQLRAGVNGANFTANGVLTAARGFVEGPNGIDFASGVTSGNAFTWGTGAGYTSEMTLDYAGNLALATGSITATAGNIVATAGNVLVTAGKLGIGMAPSHAIDITQTQNGASSISLLNASTGAAAVSQISLSNGTHVGALYQLGASFTTSGLNRADGTVLYGAGAGGLTLGTATAPIYFAPGAASGSMFDTTGRLGIGMTPANVLDITQNQNANSMISLVNASTGGGATSGLNLGNASTSSQIYMTGSSFTTTGMLKASQLAFVSNGPGGMALINEAAQPITFGINNSEIFRITSTGTVAIGATSSPNLFAITPISSASYRAIVVNDNTGASVFYSDTADQTVVSGESYAHSAIYVRKNISTSRSISASGTLNASGADYAEYRQLIAALYGQVPKGALLGYDANGLMTNVFANVIGRVLPKSTSPSYVGNDSWGTVEAITAAYGIEAPGDAPTAVTRPTAPTAVTDPGPGATAEQTVAYKAYVAAGSAYLAQQEAYETYQSDLAAYASRQTAYRAALETERVKWDRIALCGVVPINISGLGEVDIGKYLVPCAAADGTITATAVAKANLTLMQYIDSFGTIEMIGADGRPLVNVKNG